MSDNAYSSLKIENIVASGVIADEIDLAEISSKIEGCELNTKRFPGAVYRIDEPRMASLIFSSGKVVLTGIRNEESLDEGLNKVLSSLKEAGVKILPVPKVAVTNIVCSYDIGRFINCPCLFKIIFKLIFCCNCVSYRPCSHCLRSYRQIICIPLLNFRKEAILRADRILDIILFR